MTRDLQFGAFAGLQLLIVLSLVWELWLAPLRPDASGAVADRSSLSTLLWRGRGVRYL